MKHLKNSLGFSLTEILVTLGLIAIVGSIATVSYRGYDLSIAKKDLKNSGILFANALQNCITASGGWKINHPSAGDIEPCQAGDETDSTDDTEDLKKKLNYTCPEGATCKTHARSERGQNYPSGHSKAGQPRTLLWYYCLSIEKEVSGKTIQVFIRFPLHKPSDYEIWCGEVTPTTIVKIKQSNCRGGVEGTMNPLKKSCEDWK